MFCVCMRFQGSWVENRVLFRHFFLPSVFQGRQRSGRSVLIVSCSGSPFSVLTVFRKLFELWNTMANRSENYRRSSTPKLLPAIRINGADIALVVLGSI